MNTVFTVYKRDICNDLRDIVLCTPRTFLSDNVERLLCWDGIVDTAVPVVQSYQQQRYLCGDGTIDLEKLSLSLPGAFFHCCH